MSDPHDPATTNAAPASSDDRIEIADAVTEADLAAVATLFDGYANAVPGAVSVDDVRAEARRLPGIFVPPRGALLIARQSGTGEVLGCVALKPLPGPGDAECRRLFVRSAARGRSVGLRLGEAIIARAREIGYRRLLIEAHESLVSSHRIYFEVGFRPIPSYYANPEPGTVYLALDLSAASDASVASGPDGG